MGQRIGVSPFGNQLELLQSTLVQLQTVFQLQPVTSSEASLTERVSKAGLVLQRINVRVEIPAVKTKAVIFTLSNNPQQGRSISFQVAAMNATITGTF